MERPRNSVQKPLSAMEFLGVVKFTIWGPWHKSIPVDLRFGFSCPEKSIEISRDRTVDLGSREERITPQQLRPTKVILKVYGFINIYVPKYSVYRG